MIIVKILGGLGNQMFQYAYALSLKKKGYDVKLDISGFDSYALHTGFELGGYRISLPIASKQEVDKFGVNSFSGKLKRKIGLGNQIVFEENLQFQKALSEPLDDRYIVGYFQNEDYFCKNRKLLLEEFSIKNDPSQFLIDIEKRILDSNNATSLHVRRGDYVSDEKTSQVHGTCSLEYYRKALKLISNQQPNFTCFVFSDDIKWVKENIQGDNVVYIDSEVARSPHEDIYLMGLCQNNIIANSSFSWWGAWLNDDENKTVIAPGRWFSDDEQNQYAMGVVPAQWLRI